MGEDAIDDPRCLVTAETLLIDGANGVCRDARLGGAGDNVAMRGSLLAVLALVLALFFRARPVPSASRAAVTFSIALIGAALGFAAILFVRADRPGRAATTARESMRLEADVRAFAIAHRCAQVVTNDCASCLPPLRLALAGLDCDAPAPITLHADAFVRGCTERDGQLVCGSP